MPWIADGERRVRYAAQIGDLVVCLGWDGGELIAHSHIEREIWFPAVIILNEPREDRLSKAAVRIDLARHRKVDLRRGAGEEVLQTGEGLDAADLAGGVLVE